MLQGFGDELARGPGFRTDHLYVTSMDTQPMHYTADQTARFYKDLLDRTRLASGVRSAALTSVVPLIGGDARGILPEGYQLPKGERSVNAFCAFVSDGYFSTMGIPIVQGRGILETDRPNTTLVAVINQQAAKHFWPNTDAVGKRFHLNDANGPLVQIVGVAKTSKYFWIAEPPLDFVYFPYTQNGGGSAGTLFPTGMTLVAESSDADASSLASVVRGVIRNIDPNMPTYDAHTMKYVYTQRAVKTPNILVQTVAALGAMGLLLAVVGLYGLVSYSVSRRNREIGVRMAIGASRRNVVVMILMQGLKLGGIGVAIGLVLSFLASRGLTSSSIFVANFTHVSYVMFAAVAIPLLLITVLATYPPARRASRVDPIRTLREE
jgi:predicted permease